MGNTKPLNPNVNRSFLSSWVLANIGSLPALLLPYGIGFYLLGSFAILGDGMPIGLVGYAIIFIILALSGAMIGAWLGVMQWLSLRGRILQSGKWIGASSLGVAIGAPISWLAHIWFLASPIVNRPEGVYAIYFSSAYAYLIFGVVLGLTIGVAQWSVLRQEVDEAGWWIIIVPVCFTLGVSFTNFYISNMQVLGFFSLCSAPTALVGVAWTTGILLRGLLQFPKTQSGAL